jgi:hypothetical protein
MRASKDMFMEVQIQAEIDESVWNELPNDYKEWFRIKLIKVEKINGKPAKEVYRTDAKWAELNKAMIEAIEKRREREEQIRVEMRFTDPNEMAQERDFEANK